LIVKGCHDFVVGVNLQSHCPEWQDKHLHLSINTQRRSVFLYVLYLYYYAPLCRERHLNNHQIKKKRDYAMLLHWPTRITMTAETWMMILRSQKQTQ
jgi:hypothetical protein